MRSTAIKTGRGGFVNAWVIVGIAAGLTGCGGGGGGESAGLPRKGSDGSPEHMMAVLGPSPATIIGERAGAPIVGNDPGAPDSGLIMSFFNPGPTLPMEVDPPAVAAPPGLPNAGSTENGDVAAAFVPVSTAAGPDDPHGEDVDPSKLTPQTPAAVAQDILKLGAALKSVDASNVPPHPTAGPLSYDPFSPPPAVENGPVMLVRAAGSAEVLVNNLADPAAVELPEPASAVMCLLALVAMELGILRRRALVGAGRR